MQADDPRYDDPDSGMRVWMVERSTAEVARCRHRPTAGSGLYLSMDRGHRKSRHRNDPDPRDAFLRAVWPSPDPDRRRAKNASRYGQARKQGDKSPKLVKYFEVYKERQQMARIMRESIRSSGSMEPTDRERNELGKEEKAEGEKGSERPDIRQDDGGCDDDRDYDDKQQQQQRPDQRHTEQTDGAGSGSERTPGRTSPASAIVRRPLPVRRAPDAVLDDFVWDEDDENTFLMADMYKDEDEASTEQVYRGTYVNPKSKQKVDYSIRATPTEIHGDYDVHDLEFC